MEQSKFKVGETVIYQNGDKFELGVIKSVIPQEYDKVIVGSKPLRMRKAYMFEYFVLYHMGETAARTREDSLHPITNSHAFTILRRSVEDSIDMDPCRQLSNLILDKLNDIVMEKYSEPLFDDFSDSESDEPSTEGLVGGSYYDMEDAVTEIIKNFK